MPDKFVPDDRAGQLQEAIDAVVQTFGYPSSLTIDYVGENGSKRTRIELESSGEVYELSHDAGETDREAELVRID